METIVEFKEIFKTYRGKTILDNINLCIDDRDFMVIFGPPSSGRSTLLRILAGLEAQDAGHVFLRGQNIKKIGAKERSIGYIPQDFALFPNKTVFENIAYPLRLLKLSGNKIKKAVLRTADMLSITDLLEKLPTQVSGGQKQRIAIARGIVKNTDIYIFDDPLAGLDFKLREKLIDDLKSLQRDLQVCIIYTTSDPVEALSLASKIAILDNHSILETGDPETIYSDPGNLSTMKLLGFPRANIFTGTLYKKDENIWCGTKLFDFPIALDDQGFTANEKEKVSIGLRPENILKNRGGKQDDKAINILADIYLREDLGAEEIIYMKEKKENLVMVGHAVSDSGTGTKYDVNDRIGLSIRPSSLFVFNNSTRNRIGRGLENINV